MNGVRKVSMDQNTGIPFLPEEDMPRGDSIQQAEERNRRLFILGGAIGGLGGYMGPVYPVLLDPVEDERERDPNP